MPAPPPTDPDAARAALAATLRDLCLFVLLRPQAGLIAAFVMREMARPSPALDLIYDGAFEGIHRRLCALWAAATGLDAESEGVRLAVFSMLGQILYFHLVGPVVRQGAAARPLFLIVVRGKDNQRTRREPLPFLVNALPDGAGGWRLPLPVATLLFWAWQRWEIEVAHRELKANFGLGNKQCWQPTAAVLSVQWSAWVYAILLLAGYRTWGLCSGPPTPARWWPGAKRWSFTTLWRAYRSELWNKHEFRALWTTTADNWWKKETWLAALDNSIAAPATI